MSNYKIKKGTKSLLMKLPNILLLLLFFSFNSYAQEQYLINAESGLNVREKPSVNASKIAKYRMEF